MWHYIIGRRGTVGDIVWESHTGSGADYGLDGDGVMIAILMDKRFPKFAAEQKAEEWAQKSKTLDWLQVRRGNWDIDLDGLGVAFPSVKQLHWLQGSASLEPAYETEIRWDGRVASGLCVYLAPDMFDLAPDVRGDVSQEDTPTSLSERWERIKTLGDPSGQGVVTLVYDKFRGKNLGEVYSQIEDGLVSILEDVSGMGRDIGAQKILDAIVEYQNRQNPDCLGALKQLKPPEEARDPERAPERVRREIESMSNLKHPNLLKILDKDADQQSYVSEFHPNGTLDPNPA